MRHSAVCQSSAFIFRNAKRQFPRYGEEGTRFPSTGIAGSSVSFCGPYASEARLVACLNQGKLLNRMDTGGSAERSARGALRQLNGLLLQREGGLLFVGIRSRVIFFHIKTNARQKISFAVGHRRSGQRKR